MNRQKAGLIGFGALSLVLLAFVSYGAGCGERSSFGVARGLLLVGYYLLAALAYRVRDPARYQGKGFWEGVFPYASMFLLPLFIAVFSGPKRAGFMVVGNLLGMAGLSLSFWALWHLRRSFAISVAVRGRVRSGPYRFVDHPMYMGEWVNLFGFWLGRASPTSAAFLLLLALSLVVRARLESCRLSGTIG